MAGIQKRGTHPRRRVAHGEEAESLGLAASSQLTALPAEPEAGQLSSKLEWGRVSLLWRVFGANAVVFVAAFATLAWAPVTVHRVATPGELLVLSVGLLLMLVVDLLLLRRAFGPLRRPAAALRTLDPAQPSSRAVLIRRSGGETLAVAAAVNAMLDRLEKERRESGRRVLAAQERERSRIARELHDEVGQTLTAIALRAERAATDLGSQTQALTEVAETALRGLEDVRRIGRELRPEALDDLGLVNALITLCTRVDRQQGLRVNRDLEWQLPELSPEVELVIYRTAQEALTNALRHSRASEVAVSLRRELSEVVLTVSDDGRGLPERVDESGLRGMRERAAMIEAHLQIAPAAPGGTQIVLRIPV
jgi:two-component system sensor histidine kinase UhpB